MDYHSFINARRQHRPDAGFTAYTTPYDLFDFQHRCVEWATSSGRVALFADTGLGKTRMQLAWASEVRRHTGGRVLILAPLAVGPQTVREASACGVHDVTFARSPDEPTTSITVSNYDNLDKWNDYDEAGIVLDESSILKNFSGATKLALTERFRATPYRLACTATPAPNDYTEIGTHAEWLGVCSRAEMLATYFVNDIDGSGGAKTANEWRLKGHAVTAFWDWVASWSRMVGLPSDVGPYPDSGYVLPPLHIHRHVVDVDIIDGRGDSLFRLGGLSATSVNAEKRRTASDRAAVVARILHDLGNEPAIVWCDSDADADAVRTAFPNLVEVHGSDTPDQKASRLLGFADGAFRVLLTKPKIAGYGLNWQHCANVIFMGLSYSYESFYQAIRRCWRFGQHRPVHVHVVIAATEAPILATIQRKQDDHDVMKAQMFAASRRAVSRQVVGTSYRPNHIATLPSWIVSQ